MDILSKTNPAYAPPVTKLAEKYGFNIISTLTDQPVLEYIDGRLSFYTPSVPAETMCVDFLKGRTGYRLSTTANTSQPLLKAINYKTGQRLRILDATAGLGADSMLMAVSNCEVTMCERNPVMAALLEDGLDRARDSDQPISAIIDHNISFIHANAINVLKERSQEFDAVYFDPMFPERKKSAKVKKEMRLAALAVGDDEDSADVLKQAIAFAPRIIVKRPLKAEPILAGFARQLKGRSVRFDIYQR